jgi:hypothetical protein
VSGTGLLSGLRVVEVSSFVAAPLGGMTLAQLGAGVIRVDPLGGGPDRDRWPLAPSGASLYWAGLNKGKRSITADFRSAEGRELVARLITAPGPEAGIVLTNQGARPWLAYEQLAARRTDLIHVNIQGRHAGSAAGFAVGEGVEPLDAGLLGPVVGIPRVLEGLYALKRHDLLAQQRAQALVADVHRPPPRRPGTRRVWSGSRSKTADRAHPGWTWRSW